MERKLARAQGQRTEDETRALRERIEELGGSLKAVSAEHAVLSDQARGVGGGASAPNQAAARPRSSRAADGLRRACTRGCTRRALRPAPLPHAPQVKAAEVALQDSRRANDAFSKDK